MVIVDQSFIHKFAYELPLAFFAESGSEIIGINAYHVVPIFINEYAIIFSKVINN